MSNRPSASSNPMADLAWDVIETTGASLFLTGKAGTGKTTFLNRLREKSGKRMIILAPTGIAAINAGGVTIHSFFQLPFSPYVPGSRANESRSFKMTRSKLSIIRSLDLLVIDEISMVRADLLDAIDDVLKRLRRSPLPFGGVQLLLIGDLQQLPPVVKDSEVHLLNPYYASPYFFESLALKNVPFRMIELTKVYRQSNLEFVSLLNEIRDGNPSDRTLARLNARVIPGFNPPDNEGYVILTTHNEQARLINETRLNKLSTQIQSFSAHVDGLFPESSYPAEVTLELKVGAQVMFVKNDPSPEKEFYNGMIGAVADITGDTVYVRVPGRVEDIKVQPQTWENNRYEIDAESGDIKEIKEGSFSQLPLRLAWAITIHKSQGLTFAKAVIDASRSFAHGQAYVALSRCQTLEGMVLQAPLTRASVICDGRVQAFTRMSLSRRIDDEELARMRGDYRLACLDETFCLEPLLRLAEDMYRVTAEAFSSLYPVAVGKLGDFIDKNRVSWRSLFSNFAAQYRRILSGATGEGTLSDRLRAAAGYYLGQLGDLKEVVGVFPDDHDNKELRKRFSAARTALEESVSQRVDILHSILNEGFSVEGFLRARSKGVVENHRREAQAKSRPSRSAKVSTADMLHPDLYFELRRWRRSKAEERDVPSFTIMHDKTLLAIANEAPQTMEDLLAVPGMGKKRVEFFGKEILDVVASVQS
ncbi:MAG: AAA family ATPase [Bacteroides sp.]|nr:AAA family ATPase [Bacteroides sp.]